jgi:hypothetical protein
MDEGKRAADQHFWRHHGKSLEWKDEPSISTANFRNAFYVVRELEITER